MRTVELFLEEGAKVVFTGRRRPEGEALARPQRALVAPDAAQEDDWKIIAEAAQCFGPRLNYLFKTAGGPAPIGGITTIPVEGFDAAMALLVRRPS